MTGKTHVPEATDAGFGQGKARLAVASGTGTLVAIPEAGDGTASITVALARDGYERPLARVDLADATAEQVEEAHVRVWSDGLSAAGDKVTIAGDDLVPTGAGLYLGPWRPMGDGSGAEDKDGFARAVSLALATMAPDRYGRYATEPMRVESSADGADEFLFDGNWAECVSGNSLTALGRSVMRLAEGSSEHRIPASTARQVLSRRDGED